MSQELVRNYAQIESLSKKLGGVLFGVADLDPLKPYLHLSEEQLAPFHRGICVGVILSPQVLNEIVHRPTFLYKWHYRQANNLLDKIAFHISQTLLQQGYASLPIPSSQVIDWKKQIGHVSHRTVAEAAGLGWRGRNNLLVTPQYGAHVRLVTVLTDMPLSVDEPMENGCGTCMKCVNACPAGALGNSAADYDFNKCHDMLRKFSKIQGIGQMICGVCVKTCTGKDF